MRISVITASYNCVKSLKRTMESVLSQSYEDIEYLVVDGGSTDGTLELLNQIDDKKMIWKSERDNGISDAFNKGIERSTGDYTLFLNAGDYLIDQNVLLIVAEELERIGVDVLFYKVKVDENVFIPSASFGDVSELIWDRGMIPHQGAFIRKNVFNRVGIYNGNFKVRMDYDFFCRCKSYRCTYKYKNKVIVQYEKGGTSMLRKNKYQFYKEGILIDLQCGHKPVFSDWMILLKSWVISKFFA